MHGSAAIVVESASALDAETPLVGVIAQELTGTFRDALAHCGVVLLYGFQPQTPADEQLYAEGLDQVQRRGDARRMRLVAAEKGIPGVLWSILIFGGVAAVGFTYLFGLENTWAHRLMVVTLAAVIGLVLFTIGAMEHPFSGGARIGTEAFDLVLERFETSKLSELQ
jgi:hypothetical protein